MSEEVCDQCELPCDESVQFVTVGEYSGRYVWFCPVCAEKARMEREDLKEVL